MASSSPTEEVGEGMGLGLSLCNRIMEQHGGRIGVKSEEGRYGELVLVFPTNKEDAKGKDGSLRFSNGQ
ncbi:MAG: ATP-binding protein [Acidobacteria bacterium]|nr:ATP-binding protein [Acidobacteriota bacterium]